jgi:diguanylate cyclase (GGDEF)-like protein/PAS domain S-box-containing protein
MFEEKKIPLVLVVDDDIFMRGMLQSLLEEQGYHVAEAQDGVEALNYFRQHRPNLVLMDAAMPVMDGFTACAELTRLQKELGADTPVIMVTSLDDEQSVDKAFEAGAVEYITKPVHWSVLRHRVQIILQARWAEEALRQSEARFRGIFEQAAMGIALINLDGRTIHANAALQKMLGQTEASLLTKTFPKLFYPQDTLVEKEFKQLLLNGTRSFYQMEKYFFRPGSAMLWGRITTSLVIDNKQQPQYLIEMVEDITERKRAEARQRLAAKVFETTSDAVMISNAEGNIVDVNQAFLLTTHYSYEEVLDKNPRFLQSGHHDRLFFEQMWTQARETGRWRGEIWNRRKNGEVYSTWMSLSAVRGEHNEITHYVSVYSDISSLGEDDERIRLLTHYDSLTELPNRLLFNENITRACRQEERLALLYLDLDDFKQVNEHFGFDVGDELLKMIAKRLKQCVREGDTVARLDDDEFGIILAPLYQDYDARLIAESIFAVFAESFTVREQPVVMDCNIGICIHTNDISPSHEQNSNNVEILIQRADMAMYLAKEAGKNTFHIYSGLEQTLA